jgi:flagellar biosynthesis protein FlhA
MSHHLSVAKAVSTYSILSVGDGLVSQIPALLLSVSTGLIVTRANDADDMGTVVSRQLGSHKRAIQIAGGAALMLCIVPGLPKLPFLIAGGGLFIMAGRVSAKPDEDEGAEVVDPTTGELTDPDEALLQEIRVDPLELVLSPDLVPLVDGPGADLLDRVRSLRRTLAAELGIVMPAVRTRDSVNLPGATYAINVNGVELGRGQAPVGKVLAIGDGLDGLPGTAAREPVFGLASKWLPVELSGQAELLGATVVDRSSLITTHLSEAVRQNASRLLGREEVAAATRALKRSHPVVVEDLTPALLNLGEVQRVLHALLDEGVSIRDLVRIYEALSVAAKGGTDPDRLVEAARLGLAPAIVSGLATDNQLDVLTIDPRLQQKMLESLRPGDGGSQLVLAPDVTEGVLGQLSTKLQAATNAGHRPVLVCAAPIRLPLRRLARFTTPDLSVLSFPELAASAVSVNAIGVIDDVRDLVSGG